jgi:hypothetical protein
MAALPTLAQHTDSEEVRAIGQVIERLYDRLSKHDGTGVASLFADDGDVWGLTSPGQPSNVRGKGVGPVATGRKSIAQALEKPEIWSEVSGPYLRSHIVRFVTPGVVIADTEVRYYGSLIVRQRFHEILILKKVDEGWRIASYRPARCGVPQSMPPPK